MCQNKFEDFVGDQHSESDQYPIFCQSKVEGLFLVGNTLRKDVQLTKFRKDRRQSIFSDEHNAVQKSTCSFQAIYFDLV